MKILIANPNMTQGMTDLMVAEARRTCRPDTEIAGVSAAFGVPYIATHSESLIAGYALLETLARHHRGYDAVIVGAFCQSFVAAAKELMPIPVVGIAEASMRAAQVWGRRVTILGVGTLERGANQEIVSDLEMQSSMASIRVLPQTGTELARDQVRAEDEVVRLGLAAVEEDQADVLILAGGAFAGMAARVAPRLPVPVVSPIPYAVGLAEVAVLTGFRKPTRGTFSAPGEKATEGIGVELAAFYRGMPR